MNIHPDLHDALLWIEKHGGPVAQTETYRVVVKDGKPADGSTLEWLIQLQDGAVAIGLDAWGAVGDALVTAAILDDFTRRNWTASLRDDSKDKLQFSVSSSPMGTPMIPGARGPWKESRALAVAHGWIEQREMLIRVGSLAVWELRGPAFGEEQA